MTLVFCSCHEHFFDFKKPQRVKKRVYVVRPSQTSTQGSLTFSGWCHACSLKRHLWRNGLHAFFFTFIVSSFITFLTKHSESLQRQAYLRCSYFQTPSSWPSGGSRILSMLAQSERMFCWMYCRERQRVGWGFYSFFTNKYSTDPGPLFP